MEKALLFKPFPDLLDDARYFIETAMVHYTAEQAPGWFTDWLDDLYIRLGAEWSKVTLDEIFTLSRLREDGDFQRQNIAVNMVYKMFGRLGRPITGIAGY